ncbi:M48 family metalloprotease [uncultured Draconibacterium sp.]|uniref:M48 family metalloprotease n=1 Tax=uncultured Draconibacterium sp. TaxID=1573823 RepID=UPI0025CF2818|nr:M48 family metalloprotease [uncultured Draconibacterium sp.]
MKTIKTFSVILLTVSLVLLIPSCAINPVTGKKELMFMTEEQEIAMGAQYDPTVISTFGLYDDEELLNFITEKGTEIGKISHRPDLQFHFRVLDSPVVNAFAVPGGYVYFTRGILAQFNNEAELLGVLGHEIGHVTARHSAQQQTRQQLSQFALAAGMIAVPEVAQFAGEATAAMELLFLSFSRANEREADRLGVEYSTKIGYDAHKMADFFTVLDKMQGGGEGSTAGVPIWMSTHPDPGDRTVAVNQKTAEWQAQLPQQNYAVKSDEYLKMIDGIVYGENPRHGFEENSMFYHPDLAFQFPIPKSWTLINSPLQVQIVPENKDAAIIFELTQEKGADAVAQKTISDLQLKLIDKNNVKVNGLNAVVTLSEQVSQNNAGQEQGLKILSYFIEKDAMVYTFHGLCLDANFNGYKPAFESTMKNFARLTDASKLNIQPDRIKVISINSASVSLKDAFDYYKVPQDRFEEMALLNNRELSDVLRRGDLIKILAK